MGAVYTIKDRSAPLLVWVTSGVMVLVALWNEDRIVSMRRSLGWISTSTSLASGSTATVAA